MNTPLVVGHLDFESATWNAVREWAEHRLSDCRKRNDAALPEIETAALRGEIAALKNLLGLEKSTATMASPSAKDWRPAKGD